MKTKCETKKIFLISTMIIFQIIFIQTAFVQNVLAEDLFCGAPRFYDEKGTGLSTIQGLTNHYVVRFENVSDSSVWTGNGWVKYNLTVFNNKNQNLSVCVNPIAALQSNVRGSCIFNLQPGETRNLTLELWVRQSINYGEMDVTGFCQNGQNIEDYGYPSLGLFIIRDQYFDFEDVDPQGNCFPPPAGCQEDTRLFEAFTCTDAGYVSQKHCIESCCKGSGIFYDPNAYCSSDTMCVSDFNVPPATEGKIALLCSNDKCTYENYLKYILRFQGYNVVGKSYRSWAEGDFDNFDIIVCGFSGACKMTFNSPAYNAHMEKDIPFLEIAQSRYAKAGYDFGYVTRNSASSTNAQFNTTSHDSIVENYYGQSIAVTTGISRYSAINNEYLSGTTNLAEAGDGKGSIFFKVDDALGHGKYAFIGWMPQISVSGLTADGKQILNNTLKWLKQGEAPEKLGNIAFLCKDDKCSDKDEMFLIKSFRNFGYSVTAKSYKSWGSEISDFNVIACRASNACKFVKSLSGLDRSSIISPIYDAHVHDGVAFLEIPDSSKAYAAYLFGYADDYKGKSSNVYSISIVNASDPIVNEYGGSVNIFTKKRSASGIAPALIHSNDIAHVQTSSQSYSTIFTESSSRYAFLGFFPRSSSKYFTNDAIEILRRTVDWLNCGNINC